MTSETNSLVSKLKRQKEFEYKGWRTCLVSVYVMARGLQYDTEGTSRIVKE